MTPAPIPDRGVWSDTCRVCGEAGPFVRYQLREMLFGTGETFEYARCPACGALEIVTVPVDLARHYPPDYFRSTALPPRARRSGRLKTLARRFRDQSALFGRIGLARDTAVHFGGPGEDHWLQALVSRAGLRSFAEPILDVGCGREPRSLLALQAAGFRNLRGIDPFLEGNTVYQGVPLERSSIHDCGGEYQLLTMHHSFEHVPDPVEVMRSARRLLRPDGVLLVRTPVMGTWFWDHYGTDWWELDAPRHLFVHSVRSLRRCAELVGLGLRDVVWDSTFEEVIASEQIARGVAWRAQESWAINPPAGFTDETLDSYRDLVTALNESGTAGRAAFYFRIGDTSGENGHTWATV